MAEAVKSGKVTDFLKANGCEATKDELKEFVAEKAAKDKPIELDDEELEMVAGGTKYDTSTCSQEICSKKCTDCGC